MDILSYGGVCRGACSLLSFFFPVSSTSSSSAIGGLQQHPRRSRRDCFHRRSEVRLHRLDRIQRTRRHRHRIENHTCRRHSSTEEVTSASEIRTHWTIDRTLPGRKRRPTWCQRNSRVLHEHSNVGDDVVHPIAQFDHVCRHEDRSTSNRMDTSRRHVWRIYNGSA